MQRWQVGRGLKRWHFPREKEREISTTPPLSELLYLSAGQKAPLPPLSELLPSQQDRRLNCLHCLSSSPLSRTEGSSASTVWASSSQQDRRLLCLHCLSSFPLSRTEGSSVSTVWAPPLSAGQKADTNIALSEHLRGWPNFPGSVGYFYLFLPFHYFSLRKFLLTLNMEMSH